MSGRGHKKSTSVPVPRSRRRSAFEVLPVDVSRRMPRDQPASAGNHQWSRRSRGGGGPTSTELAWTAALAFLLDGGGGVVQSGQGKRKKEKMQECTELAPNDGGGGNENGVTGEVRATWDWRRRKERGEREKKLLPLTPADPFLCPSRQNAKLRSIAPLLAPGNHISAKKKKKKRGDRPGRRNKKKERKRRQSAPGGRAKGGKAVWQWHDEGPLPRGFRFVRCQQYLTAAVRFEGLSSGAGFYFLILFPFPLFFHRERNGHDESRGVGEKGVGEKEM